MGMREIGMDNENLPLIEDYKHDNAPVQHDICGNPNCNNKQQIIATESGIMDD